MVKIAGHELFPLCMVCVALWWRQQLRRCLQRFLRTQESPYTGGNYVVSMMDSSRRKTLVTSWIWFLRAKIAVRDQRRQCVGRVVRWWCHIRPLLQQPCHVFLRNLNFHSKDGMENNLLMFYIAISPDTTYGRTFAHAIMSIGMINYDYNEVSDSYGYRRTWMAPTLLG